MPEVEYVMRVKLPNPSGFHSSPSGDTEYDEAYNRAIMSEKPDGFEIAWKTREQWPRDSFGTTWVKLYCTNRDDAMNMWKQEAMDGRVELERIRNLAKQINR